MAEDFYKILGINRDASQDDIQSAYRKLARKYHPDMNPDDKSAKQKFQEVQNAYDVLSDSSKREMYDRYGSSFESAGAGAGGPGFGGGFGGFPGGATYTYRTGDGGAYQDVDLNDLFGGRGGPDTGGGFADIFKQFTRGGWRQQGHASSAAVKGADLTHEVTIPFKTSISGGEVRLTVRRSDGENESITVKIPPGIADGKKIRLRGQGEPDPRGGPAGDILITVHVQPHPSFSREGNDLTVHVPVTLYEAMLGGKVDVPTPKGTITLTVPQGTSSGRRLRVKGHGVDNGKDAPGDLFAEVQVVLPKHLGDEEKDAIRQLADKHPMPDPRAELDW